MKSRKEKPTMDGIEFDSREEVEFYMWCKEAKEHGFLSPGECSGVPFNYHPLPYELSEARFVLEQKQLKTKMKTTQRCILRAHSYQPDFIIYARPRFNALRHGLIPTAEGGNKFIIDIKGGFEPEHSKEQVFRLNQKWVYAKYGIYINKVIPREFFAKTWAPDIRNRRTGWKLEKYSGCKSVQEVKPLELEF